VCVCVHVHVYGVVCPLHISLSFKKRQTQKRH